MAVTPLKECFSLHMAVCSSTVKMYLFINVRKKGEPVVLLYYLSCEQGGRGLGAFPRRLGTPWTAGHSIAGHTHIQCILYN